MNSLFEFYLHCIMYIMYHSVGVCKDLQFPYFPTCTHTHTHVYMHTTYTLAFTHMLAYLPNLLMNARISQLGIIVLFHSEL